MSKTAMLFMLHIAYTAPPHFTAEQAAELRRREDEHARGLIRQGTLLQIWRIVGTQANYSLWQADSLEALHEALAGLPMFPFLEIRVTPLVAHPLSPDCGGPMDHEVP